MKIVKDLRIRLGLEPKILAERIGINLAEYYDLESFDDELQIAISITGVARVAAALGVKPSTLFEGSPERTVSLDDFASAVLQYLKETTVTVTQLEEMVGWDLQEALRDPRRFLEFSPAGLRDVCQSAGLNWLEVLDGIPPAFA